MPDQVLHPPGEARDSRWWAHARRWAHTRHFLRLLERYPLRSRRQVYVPRGETFQPLVAAPATVPTGRSDDVPAVGPEFPDPRYLPVAHAVAGVHEIRMQSSGSAAGSPGYRVAATLQFGHPCLSIGVYY